MDTTSSESYIHMWSTYLAQSGQSRPTSRRYISVVRAFMCWFEGQNNEHFNPQRLTPIDLVGYRNALQLTNAVSTVNVHVCALRAFCDWLTNEGTIKTNPALRLKVIGTQAPLAPKAVSSTHINALLREAMQTRHPNRDYAIVQMLIQTGVRISECVALRLADVQMSDRQGHVVVRAGKGNKARVVPLNASARRALVEYLALRWNIAPTMHMVLTTWTQHAADEPLWQSQKGNRLSIRAMSGMIEQLVAVCAQRKLVPPETSAHTLRHTFASHYLHDHPGDLVGLAALLGHSSLETTRIYVQPTADELSQRVERSHLNAYS